jgi:hypothetical protein
MMFSCDRILTELWKSLYDVLTLKYVFYIHNDSLPEFFWVKIWNTVFTIDGKIM